MDIDSLVNEKLEADMDFNNSLADLSEEDKNTAITLKRSEILKQEFSSLKERAEKVEKAEELAKNQKIRAENAEKKLKEKPEVNADGLSTKDILALSKVDEEDIDEVTRVAKILGKTVAEALKDSTLNTILSVREEERKTARATQTRGGAPSSNASGETLLNKALKGELPENEEDIEKLVEHEMASKIALTKK